VINLAKIMTASRAFALAAVLLAALLPSWCGGAEDESVADSKVETKIVPIRRSDADWKRRLTSRQFEVTRRKGTDPAYSGSLWNSKRRGMYRCVCCGLEVFSSEAKFDSQTGWPSFWKPSDAEHIKLANDTSELPARVEVVCARCDAHLGHVFDDGPQPTGLRYCINGTALRFVEAGKRKP
jgi:peptide-methionine (R)-S-oxide reductase